MGDDATYYQQHKDDEAEWGPPAPAPARRRESRRLASMVSVRFSPEEVDRLRGRADDAGLSLSGYVRHVALDVAASPVLAVELERTVTLSCDPSTAQVVYDGEAGRSVTKAQVA